jgi:hypothetical protein
VTGHGADCPLGAAVAGDGAVEEDADLLHGVEGYRTGHDTRRRGNYGRPL